MIGDFVAEHEEGRTPEPVRAVQRRDQVRSVPAHGPTSSASTWSPPVTTCGRSSAPTAAGACGAEPTPPRISPTCSTCSGSGQLARSLFPVGGMPKDRDPPACRAARPAGRGQARLPGALLRAERRRRRVRAIAGPLARARRRRGRRPRRRRAGRARRHVRVHGGAAPRAGGRDRVAGVRAGGRRRAQPRRRRAPGAALATRAGGGPRVVGRRGAARRAVRSRR